MRKGFAFGLVPVHGRRRRLEILKADDVKVRGGIGQ